VAKRKKHMVKCQLSPLPWLSKGLLIDTSKEKVRVNKNYEKMNVEGGDISGRGGRIKF